MTKEQRGKVTKKEGEMMSASVKVMRSYDYCHFEICLGTDEAVTLQEVDNMRKEAMRLVDKAVAQYQAAKEVRDYKSGNIYHRQQLSKQAEQILDIPESERSPEQKAILKEWEDVCYKLQRQYDYEDDWDW